MKNALLAGGVLLFVVGGCLAAHLVRVSNLHCPACGSKDLEFLRNGGEAATYRCLSCKGFVADRGGIMGRTEEAVEWVQRDVLDPAATGKMLDAMSGETSR